MGSLDLQFWTHIGAMNRQRIIANFIKFAIIFVAARFMESRR